MDVGCSVSVADEGVVCGECQGWVSRSDRVAGWDSCGFGILYRAAVAGWMGRVRTVERAGREEGGCGFGDVKCGGVGQLRIGDVGVVRTCI